jgi:hypothetical protein
VKSAIQPPEEEESGGYDYFKDDDVWKPVDNAATPKKEADSSITVQYKGAMNSAEKARFRRIMQPLSATIYDGFASCDEE